MIINIAHFPGYTSSSKMQMSEEIPSGANRCQQIPGKDFLIQVVDPFHEVIQCCVKCKVIFVKTSLRR